MRVLTIFILGAVIALMAPISYTAHAFGAGIGVTFPASSSGSSAKNSGYVGVRLHDIIYELTAKESRGALNLTLKVTNDSDSSYSVSHRTSQEYDFSILDEDGTSIWRWSDDIAFLQALSSTTIAPHKSVTYQVKLDSKDYRRLKKDGVLAAATLLDSGLELSTTLPLIAVGRTPTLIHGGIIFGRHDPADYYPY